MWISYHNGMEARPVFFNGKRWDVARVASVSSPNHGRCYVGVFGDSRQRWPRVFGVGSPQSSGTRR